MHREQLPELEARIAAAHPELMIIERVVILRTAKLMGRRLDQEGRSVDTVPMDIWSDAECAQSGRAPQPAFIERQGLHCEGIAKRS